MIAFIFPGQGSQQVGMGKALADRFPVARQTFDEADDAFAAANVVEAGLQTRLQTRRLSTICWEGPEADLQLTEITQPAIVTVSIAAYRVLAAHGITPSFVAGHSLGEYSAHVAAGTFSLADAVGLVRRRGRYMQEAVPVGVGSMAAILGADLSVVTQACEDAAQGEVV
ncbi:MAG TPA: ACP S-malonyltransferase, partial [Vicinamibacterales bacterium]